MKSQAELLELENQQTHELYVRTHGDYAPGEQRKRNYDWPGLDPNTHSFGVKGATTETQVTDLLRMPEPTIVSKVQADFNLVHKDELGKPKTLGRCLFGV